MASSFIVTDFKVASELKANGLLLVVVVLTIVFDWLVVVVSTFELLVPEQGSVYMGSPDALYFPLAPFTATCQCLSEPW